MRSFLVLIGLLVVISSHGREMAITLDDCPRKSGPVMKPMERDEKIISALKKENITAAFFCNSPKRQPDGLERLKFFAKSGHLIANHSADHPDLNKMGPEEFNQNIDRADLELRNLSNFRKWFRFPMLREGKDAKDVEAVRDHLKKIGYLSGYVTIDTQDWFVDEVLRQKVVAGKSYDVSKLCQAYAQIIVEDAEFHDLMSVGALGRSVKHVILLHETDLNAICLSAVLQELKKQKWSFISPDEAYRDPIAMMEPKSTTKLSQGRLFALAKEAGYQGEFYSKWNKESEIEKELELQKIWR